VISAVSDRSPHIFFSPHADDVVLSCGGTIHSLLSERKTVEVIGVFAGIPDTPYSAYARHLHKKWRLDGDPIARRWHEDQVAMDELGVTKVERWDYEEGPYRLSPQGDPIYSVDEQLTGRVTTEDGRIRDDIWQRIQRRLTEFSEPTLYFPLSLGNHVDHRILFEVGLQLRAAGAHVLFYEDFPYAESYRPNGYGKAWDQQTVPVAIEPKLRAAFAYKSQIRGLGGSLSALSRRLRAFADAAGNGQFSERFWTIDPNAAKKFVDAGDISQPHVPADVKSRPRDLMKFVNTFKWHDLEEVLPVGDGHCLDVGCGSARHRTLVESRGYQWIGVDRNTMNPGTVCTEATALPMSSNSMAAIIAWQVLEYVEEPARVFAEAYRVLEPGGVFVGSASFMEPVHGHTYFNLSPIILKRLLVRHGFGDIDIKPGLNGFALMWWTWLLRTKIPFADTLAIPFTFLLLVPLATSIYILSWLRYRLRLGDGHVMRWLTEIAPLDFAGHVLFVARKKARN
jgi:SAM-dependent methyltransferase/LmbE family N-acetylglucosaminyl deacetylase